MTQKMQIVKERPIIMSAESVRAILEGRKTQTRRVIKSQPPYPCVYPVLAPRGWIFTDGSTQEAATHPRNGYMPCPYGVPGDRLWMRETWAQYLDATPADDAHNAELWRKVTSGETTMVDAAMSLTHSGERRAVYAADYGAYAAELGPWRPSIFMPRWASRLTLELTKVRVERVQDISHEDCIAEGLTTTLREHDACCHLKEQYAALWDSINGKKHPWSQNDWVWVLEFKKLDTAGNMGEVPTPKS